MLDIPFVGEKTTILGKVVCLPSFVFHVVRDFPPFSSFSRTSLTDIILLGLLLLQFSKKGKV